MTQLTVVVCMESVAQYKSCYVLHTGRSVVRNGKEMEEASNNFLWFAYFVHTKSSLLQYYSRGM